VIRNFIVLSIFCLPIIVFADLESEKKKWQNEKNIALFHWIEKCDFEKVKFIIEKGAMADAVNNDGLSAFQVSVIKECFDIANYILKALDEDTEIKKVISAKVDSNPFDKKGENWKWGGDIEASILVNYGNTENSQYAFMSKLYMEKARWYHEEKIEILYTKIKQEESQSDYRFQIHAKHTYDLSDQIYILSVEKWYRDNLIDYELTGSIGVGWRIIKKDHLKLKIETGPGGTAIKGENSDREIDAILRFATIFEYIPRDWLAFKAEISDELRADQRQLIVGQLGILFRLTQKLGFKLGYDVRYDSEPPSDMESWDYGPRLWLIFKF
jgi:putative salt-induced outer membrane protein YdiY